MNSAVGSWERVLLAAGTRTYRHGADFAEPLANLSRVPDALQWVVEALTDLGYESEVTGARKYLLDPSLRRLKEAVRVAAGSAPVVVVYYTGHGVKPERSPYYLLTAWAKPNRLGDTALEARQLLDLVLRQDAHGNVLPGDEQPQVLLMLDCCFSGAGGIESLKESLQGMGNPKVWVLASASRVQYAEQGLFAAALRKALMDPDVGSAQEFLGLDWVVGNIKAILGKAEQKADWFPPGGESGGPQPFFPNPKYVPGVAGRTVAEQHWWSRLRGAPADSVAAGFYVTGHTGRFRAVEDLAGWMRDPDRGGLAVVTGSPGSGKSAMLALPLLLTAGQQRDVLCVGAAPGSLLARAADLFDGLPVIGVHVRGMNPYQIAEAIAQHLGRIAISPDELLTDLEDHPETSSRTVVIDAVDEARDPRRLLTDLLLPLAGRPRLRVLIGARPQVLPPLPDTSLVVDLDTDNYHDPQAIADYAHQLLVAALEPNVPTPYRGCDDDLAATVAAAIAEKATARLTPKGRAESFLLAQLLARGVRGRQQVIDVTRTGWADQLPADFGAAFDEDLLRLGRQEPIARALLGAVAWANGPGLPWERIWVPVARALDALRGDGVPRLENGDVRWLLEHAGEYVVEDLGSGGRSVFRPFHDLLAAHLRGQLSGEGSVAEPATGDTWRPRFGEVEEALTRALLSKVPAGPEGRPDWELAHPYLRTYLAQHAHAANPGTFAALVADLDYLAVAEPATLTPLLIPTDPALRLVAQSYRRARPLLGPDLRANAAYLQEATRAVTGSSSAGVTCIRPRYHTLLTSIGRDDSLLTITGHTSEVTSVAFARAPDGGLLLASGSHDGSARLWDPATGSQLGEPLTAHVSSSFQGEGVSVAFSTTPGGHILLAIAGDDGTVQLWDPLNAGPARKLLTGHIGSSFQGVSLAFGTTPDGRLLLVTAGEDRTVRQYAPDGPRDGKTVRLWDVETGTAVGESLAGHASGVWSVACSTASDGRLLLATGNSNGTVRLWDPSTGREGGRVRLFDPATGDASGREMAGHAAAVSVAFGTTLDGRVFLATTGGGTARLWDALTGTPVTELQADQIGAVSSVAFGTTASGRLLIATGTWQGTVQLWDPLTGAPVGGLQTGHTGEVTSVACGTGSDGRLLLATGGEDGTVRLWDPLSPAAADKAPTVHTGPVGSVAFGITPEGRLLLATGGDGGTVRQYAPATEWKPGTVRLWDAVTGAAVGEPLRGHTGPVGSVAFGTTSDGQLLLASGGQDGEVRLWDPATGGPANEIETYLLDVIGAVAFGTTPDGRLVLAHGDATGVWLWNLAHGQQECDPLTPRDGQVYSVAFGTTPDGHLLLACSAQDGTVRLWDPFTGVPADKPLTGHTGPVYSVAFGTTSDGHLMLATGGHDTTVRLWDPVSRTAQGDPLTGHTGPVASVAFCATSNGRPMVASGGDDGTVRLWDPATRACMATLRRRCRVHSVAGNGAALAISDDEGICIIQFTD